MVRASGQPLTLDQFLCQPEVKPAREYEDGEVVQKPMPSIWHGVIQRLLSVVFSAYFSRRPDADGGSEIRCVFGPAHWPRSYVPDYVVVLDAAARGFFGNRGFGAAPDLAVEIRSPDDRPGARERTVAFYLAHGVRMVWQIDPELRTVVVRLPGGEPRRFTEAGVIDGLDVLPGLGVPQRDILPATRPPPAAPRDGI
jgi:Uma2 family endonuclease